MFKFRIVQMEDDSNLTKQKLVDDSAEVDKHEKNISELKRQLSIIKDTDIPHNAKRKEALIKLSNQLRNQTELLKKSPKNLTEEDKKTFVVLICANFLLEMFISSLVIFQPGSFRVAGVSPTGNGRVHDCRMRGQLGEVAYEKVKC